MIFCSSGALKISVRCGKKGVGGYINTEISASAASPINIFAGNKT